MQHLDGLHGSVSVVSFEELVASLGDPVVIIDQDGRITAVNVAARQVFGRGEQMPLVGRTCCTAALFGEQSTAHVTEAGGAPGDEWSPRSLLDITEVTRGRRLLIDNPRSGRRSVAFDSIPLHSEHGGLAGHALVFRDDTEDVAQRREGEWLRRELLDSRRQVERELARTTLLEAVAVAASSAIDLRTMGLAIVEAVRRESPLRASALVLQDAENRRHVVTAWEMTADEALGSVDRAWVTDGTERGSVDASAHEEADVRQAVIPIRYRKRELGALVLRFSGAREFDRDELDTYLAISDVLGQAIENARLYAVEHRIAETLQETLVVLPSHVPGVVFSRAYESATYEPGWVGGDFVDVFQAGEHLVGITLGGVSGKGIDAAVTTSTIRTTIRVHALDGRAPAEIAKKANEVMRRFSDVDAFVTLWFGLLDTRTGSLQYVCAGHPPALVLSERGDIREIECHDPILGAFDETRFSEGAQVLAENDRLILYSDGVTEARGPDGTFMHSEGLLDLLKRHRDALTPALAPALMREVVSFSEGVLRDDAAILVIEAVDLE
jgi:serine phosphatase RsbU (regulator of sigma subunit)